MDNNFSLKPKYPAVFLDRDGVLCWTFIHNAKPYAPRRLEDFILIPHALHSIMLLQQVGFKIVVVTNQPDIGTVSLRLKW